MAIDPTIGMMERRIALRKSEAEQLREERKAALADLERCGALLTERDMEIVALKGELRDYERSMGKANARIRELEAEVERELQGQVEITSSGGRMYAKLSTRIAELETIVRTSGESLAATEAARLDALDRIAALEEQSLAYEDAANRLVMRLQNERSSLAAVVAPLLPLLRERAEDWERMNSGRSTVAGRARRPLPMPDNITLTAEFPTAALRALLDESAACPLCAGRGYVPDPRFPGSARVVWCSCPAARTAIAAFGASAYATPEQYFAGKLADGSLEPEYVGYDPAEASIAERAERRADAALDPDGSERGRR